MHRHIVEPCLASRVHAMLLLALLFAIQPVVAGVVTVVEIVVEDNGDGDGIGDSGETLSLRPVLHNSGTLGLTGVSVTLTTTDATAHLGCATASTVSVGSLAAGETRESPPGLTVVVPPGLQRVDPYELLAATFDLSVTSDQIPDAGRLDGLALELDLDLGGGSTPNGYFETFESAIGDYGDFVPMNLDEGQWDPCPQDASQGFRCQRHEPNCGASCTTCEIQNAVLGTSTAHTELFHWRIDAPDAFDGGRAFSGARSLHMGLPLGSGLGHTTPVATLEAVSSGTPLHIGWDRVCEQTRSISCNDSAGCPTGEACVPARPTLSFKHQVSLVDTRFFATDDGGALDRAVVQARLLDTQGQPASDWTTIVPYLNTYDSFGSNTVNNPMFDPIDDGNTEDDLYPGVVSGMTRVGPSSTCFPARCFTDLGDTDAPFSPLELGQADGPGLPGSSGIGTWVESRFDLDRFRGRTIQIRFLTSHMKLGLSTTWDGWPGLNPSPVDDGWWIDDVEVSDTLAVPATAAIDLTDNSGLPAAADGDGDGIPDACDLCFDTASSPQFDLDGDGFGNACDCGDADDTVYPGAPELYDGIDNQCAGDPGHGLVDELAGVARFVSPTRFEWSAQNGVTTYQVVRSRDRALVGGCFCAPTVDPFWDDPSTPTPGAVLYYVPRAIEPSLGSAGARSDGLERAGRCVVDACAP